jgi:MoaA/NifB/PqqE/SkfB family radical SAM enzyme
MNPKGPSSRSINIIFAFNVMQAFCKYRLLQPLVRRPFLPRGLVFYATYRCNSQCIMCGIWKNNASYPRVSELSLIDLDHILSDRLFKKIENLNINGGELTLRSDLPELIEVAVTRLPALKKIGLNSNGILTDQLVNQAIQIRNICDQKKIALSISISVHGLDAVEDSIYGLEGTFDKQERTINTLLEIASDGNLDLGISCVMMNANVMHLRSLQQWCQAKGMAVRFSVVEQRQRFNNLGMSHQFEIDPADRLTAIEFFQVLSRDKGLFKPYAYYYDYLANLLQYNQVRTASCEYILGAVILGSQGELYYCPHDDPIGDCRNQSAFDLFYDAGNLRHRNSSLRQQKCLHCPPKNLGYLSMQADIFKYLGFLMKRDSF